MANIEDNIDKLLVFMQELVDEVDIIMIQEPVDTNSENAIEYEIHSHPLWELKILKNDSIIIVPPGVMHYGKIPEMNMAMRFNSESFLIGHFMLFNKMHDKYFPILLPLMELYCNLPASDKKLCKSVSKSILITILRIAQMIKNEPSILANLSYFDRAMFFMRQNYWDCNISLTDIADFAGCSPQYLSRIFQDELQKSPHKTLLDIRMNHAVELLKSGKYLIGEVAKMTGWRTQFYFSNVFREYFGVSPISIRDK